MVQADIKRINAYTRRSQRAEMHRRKRKGRRDRNGQVGRRESIRWARPPYYAWHSPIFDE